MPRKPIKGLNETVLQILKENRTRFVECKEIYAELRKRIPLTPEQLEVTYDRPSYQHSVRRALRELVATHRAIHVNHGTYKYKQRKE
jgi:hypothetical protein